MNSSSLVGKQIDQYQIESYIASGGMAEVYLATDVTLQRPVALKVMLSALAVDQTAIARFRREAEAVARLDHPHIIQIYTIGLTPDNQLYLAMQFLSGGTLQQKLANLSRQGQRLSIAESLYLARQVATALKAAHQRNIVHRDLKPSNILLRADGEPVIADLGIAAMDSGSSKLTQTGRVMGTPNYMAPEQALGKRVDGRSDIYSLGIILYELIAGHVPFAAANPMAVMHQHIYEIPRSLALVRPGLAPSTYQVVDLCLQKEPDRRYQSAEQLVTALNQALMSEGLKTPQSVISYPTMRTVEKRRNWPKWAAATLVVLIIAVSVGYILAKAGEDRSPREPNEVSEQISPISAIAPEQPDNAAFSIITTDTAVPIETEIVDPGCYPGQGIVPYVGDTEDVCIGGRRILDFEKEGGGCFDVDDILPSPSGVYFAVLVNCFEGDNKAFIFRADGSDKREVTGEWDRISNKEYIWTDDGYFVYQRRNSCCMDPPSEAPPEGVVWYDPETDQKSIPDAPLPLEPYEVVNVEPDDGLHVRSAAGADNQILGTIPYDGSGIDITGMGILKEEKLWVPVRYQDLIGWVNSSYIQAEGSDQYSSAPLTTPNVTASFLSSPPIIDGSLSEWQPDLTYLSSHLVFQDSSWDGRDDVEAVWQLGWDYSNLYLAATISDDVHVQINSDIKIWQGDDVEIQIDADIEGDRGTSLNTDDFQLNVSPGDFHGVPAAHYLWRGGADGRYDWLQENDIRIGSQAQNGADYTVEIAIPWTELGISPSPGLKIGVALNVSDNDSQGTAVQEVMKSSSQNRSFDYPDTWGTLTLIE